MGCLGETGVSALPKSEQFPLSVSCLLLNILGFWYKILVCINNFIANRMLGEEKKIIDLK